MRRAKKRNRLTPFWAGLAGGYIAALAVAAVGALILLLSGSAALTGLFSIAAVAAGAFAAGRISGGMRRRRGLATGALSGVMFLAVPVLLSLVFGVMRGPLLAVKLALCVAFGSAGGVVGVNSSDS